MTLRILYNSDISRVWVNGETHDRFRDKVTPKFKKRLNKWQLVIKKNKKERKKIVLLSIKEKGLLIKKGS